ncbi:MAG: thermonuclease family protein [Candidatus Omnitrophica bacterium]|nr:thermonuclease family protein [Candidatus Omnitrophota bacterium]
MTRPVSSSPKKRHTIKKDIKNLQIAALVIASLVYLGYKSLPFTKYLEAKEEFCYVERVVDGDTLKLSDGRKVRLIGVDTPELHYSGKLLRDARKSNKDIKTIQAMGKRASDFTKSLCSGKKVRLETDAEKYDKYGRVLAYIYLEDGTFVNAKILEEGYGQVMTIPPNVKNSEYFLRLQKEARGKGRGLWGAENGRN